LKGAKNYRVQILNQGQTIVKDTLTDKLILTIPLLNGSYYWKVRAENFAYKSTYSNPINFSVNGNEVLLSTPVDGFYTNATSFNLSWQALNGATGYDLQINNVTASTNVLSQSNINATSYALTNSIISQDAKYEWKVKPVLSSGVGSFSTRYFYIDRVVPNQPTNTSPANNTTATINTNVNFTWTMPSDSGTIQSPIEYTIEFATDAAFTSIIQTSSTTTTSFQKSFGTTGSYYWRVKAIDKAGNISATSTGFKLTI
jgi:predicted secreted protein